jgi:hypothetical protein
MVGQYHRTILDSMKPVALMWWGDPACATSAPPCWTVIWGLSAAGSTSSVHCADLTQNLGIVVISKNGYAFKNNLNSTHVPHQVSEHNWRIGTCGLAMLAIMRLRNSICSSLAPQFIGHMDTHS